MNTRNALAYRDLLVDRAAAYAMAGLTILAAVWTMGADMCRAAWWTASYGAFEAERRVRFHSRDSALGARSGFPGSGAKRGE